jgi:hypothetical protein
MMVTFVIKLCTFSLAFDHGRRKPWDAPYPPEWRSPSSLGNWTWYAVLLLTHVPDLPRAESKPVGNTGGVVFWESDPTNIFAEPSTNVARMCNPMGASVCETCAERGRPNEPVYKMGMCEFCFKGLRHPKATREELAKERGRERTRMRTSSPQTR